MWSHQDGQGTGAPLLRGEAESWDCSARRRLKGHHTMAINATEGEEVKLVLLSREREAWALLSLGSVFLWADRVGGIGQ